MANSLKQAGFLILIGMGFIFNSCSNHNEVDEISVNIRLANTSSYTFKNITVDTNGGKQTFSEIKSGEVTEYRPFSKAYRYAYIELEVEGRKAQLIPIDYVGETTLPNGKYTYQLNVELINSSSAQIQLNFIED